MRFIYFIILSLFTIITLGQSAQLARNYMDQGAYEKALTIYQDLYKKRPNYKYLTSLVDAYQQLERYTEAEELLHKQIAKSPTNASFYVELGHHFELQQQKEKAQSYYQKALDLHSDHINQTYILARAFERYSLLEQAALVYEKGMLVNPSVNYHLNLAKIYGEQGKLAKMFDSYLVLLEKQPNYISLLQRYFNDFVTEDPLNDANILLKKALIKKLQQTPNSTYNKILSWLYIQQNDYKKAFIQEKAIYKRNPESLQDIVELALITIEKENYSIAQEILNYIIESNVPNSTKIYANQLLLQSKIATATPENHDDIIADYKALFDMYGTEKSTLSLQIDYAHFLAFTLNKKQEGIGFLKQLLKKRLTRFETASVKMELADILILDEKFNQALIYYTQIQNAVKNNHIAQEARFKVAQTSYYKGDFKWAQTQLDVLKSSTSQLIANDAMELSLIISDNSLEDSTQTALKIFAKADLLAFQNKNTEAIAAYEQILTEHKGEKIEDEALLRQAKIYEKTGSHEQAKDNYLKILAYFKDDILADDAYYHLAELYANQLHLPEKAKENYEQLIFNHADSIFYVEARKKYRALRGDAIN
ncbi:tetratricopeptide repeat protein [Aquimarina rhabdastrellae]